MKRIAMILCIVLLAASAWAQEPKKNKDFDLSIQYGRQFFTNLDMEPGNTLKARLSWKGLYIFGSYDQASLRMFGQQAGYLNFWGVGAGVKANINQYIGFFVDIGYYQPTSELAKDQTKFTWTDPGREICEPLYYKFSDLILHKWNQPQWMEVFNKPGTKYDFAMSGALGGSLGIILTVPIYKGLSVDATGGYRYLQFTERFKAHGDPTSAYAGMYLETKERLDASGGIINIGLSYRW